MPTPRRRSSAPIEAGKDTTNTKVIIPEGTKADIVEQKGGKTIAYTAEVIEDEEQDQTGGGEYIDEPESIFSRFQEPPAPVIPQSPLDRLFNEINYCIEHQGAYDSFVAKLLRKPDNMNDKFNVPCRDLIDVGAFSFSSSDRFTFQQGIQEANDNSGGRFSITIFRHDYKPLEMMSEHPGMQGIGQQIVADLVIPNPKAQPLIDTNGADTQGGIGAILLKMNDMAQQNHNALMAVLNRPQQKSEMEQMLMTAMCQRMANDLTNPNTGNSNSAEALQQTMIAMFSAPAMAQKMIEKAFPEPAPEREPTLIDQVKQVFEIPAVQNASERVMDIVEAASVKGLQLGTDNAGGDMAANITQNPNGQQVPPAQQPPQQHEIMNPEQQELLTTIIDELASDNPLNAENDTIKELAADYPNEFGDLTSMCQAADFDGAFRMLLGRAAKIAPFPLAEFLNIEATQANVNAGNVTYPMPYVWNDEGLRLIERLKELHAYLKSLP